jgi:hypothetical protein
MLGFVEGEMLWYLTYLTYLCYGDGGVENTLTDGDVACTSSALAKFRLL